MICADPLWAFSCFIKLSSAYTRCPAATEIAAGHLYYYAPKPVPFPKNYIRKPFNEKAPRAAIVRGIFCQPSVVVFRIACILYTTPSPRAIVLTNFHCLHIDSWRGSGCPKYLPLSNNSGISGFLSTKRCFCGMLSLSKETAAYL